MSGVFYHSVIHDLGFFICFMLNNRTRFFYALYSDKTWIYDQSVCVQGPIYITKRSRLALLVNVLTGIILGYRLDFPRFPVSSGKERGLFVEQRLIIDSNSVKVIPLGQVVRKPVNANPGLKVNRRINFSCIKMFFAAYVLCNLSLVKLKSEGQTV